MHLITYTFDPSTGREVLGPWFLLKAVNSTFSSLKALIKFSRESSGTTLLILDVVGATTGAFGVSIGPTSDRVAILLALTRCCLATRLTVSSTLLQSLVKPPSVFLSSRSKRSLFSKASSAAYRNNSAFLDLKGVSLPMTIGYTSSQTLEAVHLGP
jgi:hypothetical protein